MKGHCTCQATGMSSHAIARRFEGCLSGGNDHPFDPGDLRRCVEYCDEMGITADWMVSRMGPVSYEWAALVHHWGELRTLLADEMRGGTGRAPKTYARMRELLDGVRA